MKIKTILPLLTCLIHGQMRPPLALSSKEKKGMFPRLKVRMEQLLLNPRWEDIDNWFMETLPQFSNLQTEVEVKSTACNDLLKLIEDKEQSYTPVSSPTNIPIMDIKPKFRSSGF